MATFKRQAAGLPLTTYLTDDLALVDSHPVLKGALAYWQTTTSYRKEVLWQVTTLIRIKVLHGR